MLFASAALFLLFWQWRPLPHVALGDQEPDRLRRLAGRVPARVGLVLVNTFLISHFELFGLRQAVMAWFKREPEAPVFRMPIPTGAVVRKVAGPSRNVTAAGH